MSDAGHIPRVTPILPAVASSSTRANLNIFVNNLRSAEQEFPLSVQWMNCDQKDCCKGYFHHDKNVALERTPRAGSRANAAKRQCTGTKKGSAGKGSTRGSGCASSASGPSGARRTPTSGSAAGRSAASCPTKSRRTPTSSPAGGRSAASCPTKSRRSNA